MKRNTKLEYWQSSKDGQWYWHLKAGNGKVVCHGEGHPTKAKAVKAIGGCTWAFYCCYADRTDDAPTEIKEPKRK